MTSRPLPHAGGPVLRYRVFLPTSTRASTPLVVVHGEGRQSVRIFRSFLPAAMRAGIPLIAPRFSRVMHADYQVLAGARGPWAAADAFEAVLADAALRHDLNTGTVDLLGFSGGAQFAHRYAMVSPERIRRLVLAAPGWYTYLLDDVQFPRGVAVPADAQRRSDVAGFLRTPTLVVVGEHDTHSAGALRHSHWLDAVQGPDRLTRAQRWTDHVDLEARRRGVGRRPDFALLPSTAHNQREAVDRGGLADLAVAHLAQEDHR